MMKPKKQLIDKAINDGAIDRMNSLLSAAYLLHCEASSLMDEASELMNKYSLLLGPLKAKQNSLERVSKSYFEDFSSMVSNNETVLNWAKDLDQFNESFRKWAKIQIGWAPNNQNKI